jgi:hypothetical protein
MIKRTAWYILDIRHVAKGHTLGWEKSINCCICRKRKPSAISKDRGPLQRSSGFGTARPTISISTKWTRILKNCWPQIAYLENTLSFWSPSVHRQFAAVPRSSDCEAMNPSWSTFSLNRIVSLPDPCAGMVSLLCPNVTRDRDIFHPSLLCLRRLTTKNILFDGLHTRPPFVSQPLGSNRSVMWESRIMDCKFIPDILHLHGRIFAVDVCDSCVWMSPCGWRLGVTQTPILKPHTIKHYQPLHWGS